MGREAKVTGEVFVMGLEVSGWGTLLVCWEGGYSRQKGQRGQRHLSMQDGTFGLMRVGGIEALRSFRYESRIV